VASTYGGDHCEGLLAKPDYQTALLSMSGYETYGATDVNGMLPFIGPDLEATKGRGCVESRLAGVHMSTKATRLILRLQIPTPESNQALRPGLQSTMSAAPQKTQCT